MVVFLDAPQLQVRERNGDFGDAKGVVEKLGDLAEFLLGVEANVVDEEDMEKLIEFDGERGVVGEHFPEFGLELREYDFIPALHHN